RKVWRPVAVRPHTGGPGGVFPDAHVTGKNDLDLIPPSPDGGTLRGPPGSSLWHHRRAGFVTPAQVEKRRKGGPYARLLLRPAGGGPSSPAPHTAAAPAARAAAGRPGGRPADAPVQRPAGGGRSSAGPVGGLRA